MPTVLQLKAEAKANGLKGYSKMRKADLERLLSNHNYFIQNQQGGSPSRPVPKPRTINARKQDVE